MEIASFMLALFCTSGFNWSCCLFNWNKQDIGFVPAWQISVIIVSKDTFLGKKG